MNSVVFVWSEGRVKISERGGRGQKLIFLSRDAAGSVFNRKTESTLKNRTEAMLQKPERFCNNLLIYFMLIGL